MLYKLVMQYEDDALFPVRLLEMLDLHAAIAYRGPVMPSALNLTVSLPFYTWWWVCAGEVRCSTVGHEYHLGPGAWIFFPPSVERRHQMTEGTTLLSISFTFFWPEGLPVVHMREPLQGSKDRTLFLAGKRALKAFEQRNGADFLNLKIPVHAWLNARAALALFTSQLFLRVTDSGCGSVERRVPDPRVSPLLKSIAQTPRMGPLAYDAWSIDTGLGRSQIDRLARAHLGMTLCSWRDARLAAEVRRRIIAGRESMKEIAFALGFVDAAHFHHWTRRHLGAAPTEIRQSLV